MAKLEQGQCSESPVQEPWAKLVPVDSNHSHIEICSNEMVICSKTTFSSTSEQNWCKIIRNPDLFSAILQNMSSTAVIVDGASVESEDTATVKCGTEIISGPDKEEFARYIFRLMAIPESSQKHLKISMDSDHAKCSICLHIWHDVVTAAPCLHNFCNGCFSEWLRRQRKNPIVQCPQCRANVLYVGKNHFLRNIEEAILESDPSLKRSSEELAALDAATLVRSNLVLRKPPSLKRPYSPPNEDPVRPELPCPQCGSSIRGFQCNRSTSHLQCQACGGMMPSRTDISVPQHCVGCDRAFCWGYWHEQGLLTSDSHAVCHDQNFKAISEYTTTRIPSVTHQNNQFEQEITERCIQHTGKTLQTVVSEWILKLNNREIDRGRMPLNHAEMITSATFLCSDCYDKLVSFLLYWFRISIPKYHLPPDAAAREDCWYGYACRTQHHSVEHARKRNHVCRPTRGTGMP